MFKIAWGSSLCLAFEVLLGPRTADNRQKAGAGECTPAVLNIHQSPGTGGMKWFSNFLQLGTSQRTMFGGRAETSAA